MNERDQHSHLLGPYRALDLTDDKGISCGKILADLGVEVINVEPPSGNPARHIGPFYHNAPDSERSLLWYAQNTNKKSITLDIESRQGQEIFKKLVRTADFVIESFNPGYLDQLGLGLETLHEINPRLIMTSITPWGQTGPYSQYRCSDIVAMAMGGQMYITGDADRPPVAITPDQAYLQGGIHAAIGTLTAHLLRQATGIGQHVDVSIVESVCRLLHVELAQWQAGRILGSRQGRRIFRGKFSLLSIFPCKDGEISFMFVVGKFGRRLEPLVKWMKAEGDAGELEEVEDWEAVDIMDFTPEKAQRWEDIFARFFLKHTKAELFEQAVKRGIYIGRANTISDLLVDDQLCSRNFWIEVEHPDLKATITYPGVPYRFSDAARVKLKRAPLLGEHNSEVLEREIEYSGHGMSTLKTAGDVPPTLITSEIPERAFQGMNVLNFSVAAAGPVVAKHMADYGANVVKLESIFAPDLTRVSGPYKDGNPGPDRSASFEILNSSQLSITLNLKKPRGLALAKRLIAWADVIIENHSPGTLEKLGLSCEAVKEMNPGIIMLSTTMKGQDGPYALARGWGNQAFTEAGLTYFVGWPDREGTIPQNAIVDYQAAWYGIVAVLAALEYRRRTGKGQHIDLSQTEVGITFLVTAILEQVANSTYPMRQGNQSDRAAPYGAYRCKGKEQWCAISVFNDQQWRGLRETIGNLEWTADPRFQTLAGRLEHRDEIDRLLERWTISMDALDLMVRLQNQGVPAGKVQSSADLLDSDPQLQHRRFWREVNSEVMGTFKHYASPARLSKTPDQIREAPRMGEHNYDVCTRLLGMSDLEFAESMQEGIFE
ncbi:MAG: CoA transferase [Chloroflexi bacterium]|nr:CoA transferase [Chloroflexota bacterium]